MSERANEKIKVILEKLLEEHSLGVNKPQNISILEFDILVGTNVQARNLNSIFEHLKEQKLLVDWIDNDGEYVMFFPDNFREKASQYLQTFEQPDKQDENVQKIKSNLSVVEKKEKVYLIYENNQVLISEKTTTKQAKLIRSLSSPEFGVLKTIDTVADEMRKANEEQDSFTDKKNFIKSNFNEIHKKLKNVNFPIRFKIKFKDGLVSMPIDEKKSGL